MIPLAQNSTEILLMDADAGYDGVVNLFVRLVSELCFFIFPTITAAHRL
jgi:hypothetical protein